MTTTSTTTPKLKWRDAEYSEERKKYMREHNKKRRQENIEEFRKKANEYYRNRRAEFKRLKETELQISAILSPIDRNAPKN